MLTGPELGKAIDEAIRLKGLPKTTVAAHFGIKGPSIYDWIKHGRISKRHLPELLRYFSDVVEPEHWGLTGQGLPGDEDREFASVLGYSQAAGLGAAGMEAQEYAQTQKLAFRRSSLRKKGLSASACRVMYGKGDSMEPTIQDGDAILFDTSDVVPKNRRIYVLAMPGAQDTEYCVKRAKVSRGKVLFVSDNIDGDHEWREPRPLTDDITVIGRVRWIGRWAD